VPIANIITTLISSVVHRTEEEYEEQKVKKIKTVISIKDGENVEEHMKGKRLSEEH
jgi:hypothetical protein